MEGRGYRSSGLSVAAEVSTARTMGGGERKDCGLGGAGGDAGLCEGMVASLPETGIFCIGRGPASTQVQEVLEFFLCKSRLCLLGWPFSHRMLPEGWDCVFFPSPALRKAHA